MAPRPFPTCKREGRCIGVALRRKGKLTNCRDLPEWEGPEQTHQAEIRAKKTLYLRTSLRTSISLSTSAQQLLVVTGPTYA